jgi:nitrate reductase gamma subunit
MDVWLRLGRGPLFWAALAFMILGLGRHAALTGLAAARAWRRAGDRDLPGVRIVSDTLTWLIPTGRLKDRWLYSVTTLAFHVGVILVPLFLAGHIALWREALGVGWPALPNAVATTLTVVVLVAAVAVVVQRLALAESRALSRLQDYLVPLVVAVPFASGLLVMHPAWNPFTRDATLLVHVLSGDLVLFLVPLTKLSHMVLLPLTQLVSELAWHFPPDAGERVGHALGKESEPI